jgi:hypothetical protein
MYMSASGLANAQTATLAMSSARIVFGRARMAASSFVVNFFQPCSHSTGSNLVTQIVAAVHQFKQHSIAASQ